MSNGGGAALDLELATRHVVGNTVAGGALTEMAQISEKKPLVKRAVLGLPVPFRAPSDALETRIVKIFADAFGMDSVGVDDDFHDLGGDSLFAETISMEILKVTGMTFNVSWFYEQGTPARVVRRLKGVVATQDSADRPPIFIVHGKMGFSSPRPEFYTGLAPGQHIEMFELPGIRGDGPSYDTIEDIAAAYVQILQRQHPVGPVLLAGFCSGGLIAIEMAHQLACADRRIQHMVLLDPGIPQTLIARHKQEYEAAGRRVDRVKKGGGKRAARKRFWLRLGTLIVLGRATDGTTARDFVDPKFRRWTARYIELWLRLRRFKAQLSGQAIRSGGTAMKLGPRARLLAAYRTYWPAPYLGAVDIIASAARKQLFEGSQVWARILPNMKVHVTADTHVDVLRAEVSSTAAEMQQLFDVGLRRLPSLAATQNIQRDTVKT